MRSCVQTAPCVTIVRFYVSLGEPVEKRIAPLWICAFKTDSGWEVRISGVQRTGGQLRQSEDRCGSKCEELEVSTTIPLSLRNSPSKRTSPIGRMGHIRTHAPQHHSVRSSDVNERAFPSRTVTAIPHGTQEVPMSTNEVRSNDTARNAGIAGIDMKLAFGSECEELNVSKYRRLRP